MPLTYHASVPRDGTRPPVCFDHLASSEYQSDEADILPVGEEEPDADAETADGKPREFTVEPSVGVLQPQSEVTFIVKLCANSFNNYLRELAVNFDEVANETFNVPITAEYAHLIAVQYNHVDFYFNLYSFLLQ